MGPVAFATIIRSLPRTIQTQLLPGIKATLDLRDETQRTTYWYGTRFEEPTPSILQEWSVGATHFFDIGSNYGFYSFLLYASAPQLEIYPFEPNPKTFARLSMICAENKTARIHPQPYGLSNERGMLDFLQLSDNSGHSSFATTRSYEPGESRSENARLITSEVMPFDEFVDRHNLPILSSPAWLAKIDVEGFEGKVLEGMRNALTRRLFKGICVELFEDNLREANTSRDAIETLFREVGYRRLPMEAAKTLFPLNHNAYFVPVD